MKKITLFIIATTLICSLIACQSDRPISETDSIIDMETDSKSLHHYVDNVRYRDMDEFMTALKEAQKDPDSLLYLGNDTPIPVTYVPTISLSEYKLGYVIVVSSVFNYCFYNPSSDSSLTNIYIQVRRGNAYRVLVDQYDAVQIDNGISYSHKKNTWILDVESRGITITFPKNINISSVEELENCVALERIVCNQ